MSSEDFYVGIKTTGIDGRRASQAESSHDEADDDVSVSKIVDHFMQISEDFVILEVRSKQSRTSSRVVNISP